MCHLPQFLHCNWYQGELWYLARPLGFSLFPKSSLIPGVPRRFIWVSAGAGACENNLSSAFWFQINALWSEYRKIFSFLFFPIAAFEKHCTDLWGEHHWEALVLLRRRHLLFSCSQWHGWANPLGHAFRLQLFIQIEKPLFIGPGNWNMPWAWRIWKKLLPEPANERPAWIPQLSGAAQSCCFRKIAQI